MFFFLIPVEVNLIVNAFVFVCLFFFSFQYTLLEFSSVLTFTSLNGSGKQVKRSVSLYS